MENNKQKELQKTIKGTELKLKQACNLSEISNVLIQLCEQAGNKIELHVHFNIQTIGDVSNSVASFVNGNENTVTTGSGIVGNSVHGGGINDTKSELLQLQENSLLIDKQIQEKELKINEIKKETIGKTGNFKF